MKIGMTIAALALTGLVAAGCTTAERTGTAGAAVGGAIGAVASGTIGGAAIGAFVGGVGGYLLGRHTDGQCRYSRTPGGNEYYLAPCPT